MSSENFTPILAATKSPQIPRPDFFPFFVKDSFALPTLLAIGAVIQTVVVAVLPARYSLLPLSILLLQAIITTAVQATSPKRNNFITDSIPARVTAQLPSPSTRRFGNQPAAESLVVFHLGVRFNHPLGVLSPGAKEIAQYQQEMMSALEARADGFGMLGASNWRANERGSNNSLMVVFYFRDIEGLNRFAHDRVHTVAWDWFHSFSKKHGYKHIGIFHETFVTRPNEYETIYVNMPPTLMGATNVKVEMDGVLLADSEAEKGPAEAYVRPLVDANHPALRSQAKRMGLALQDRDT